MKFAHMSDCHLGSWSSHPDMKDYPIIAFENALDECARERVDFIIIAGDLLDTSLPPIDVLKRTAAAMRKCKEQGVPIYVVAGSHDYSPTGKTMLSVLEEAGLLIDVCKFSTEDGKIRLKFTIDEKTGAKLTGIMGRKGGLDANYYKSIDRSIEKEEGVKIFVFHAGIKESPDTMKEMLCVSLDELPKNFNYYATGHVHARRFDEKNMIVFPGELFPTSFDELEDYNGGFAIAEYDGSRMKVKWKDNKLFDVCLFKINVTGKNAMSIEREMHERIENESLRGKVLLLKLSGTLESGKLSDINFAATSEKARAKGAIVVKRSVSGVLSKEYESVHVQTQSAEEIERSLIEQYAERLKLPGTDDIASLVANLMSALKEEKFEDETNATFEERVKSSAKKAAGL